MRGLLILLFLSGCAVPAPRTVSVARPPAIERVTRSAPETRLARDYRRADAAAIGYVARPDADPGTIATIRDLETTIAAARGHSARRRAVDAFAGYLKARDIR
jgi:hypothetical protein